jgi:hypothetical protein
MDVDIGVRATVFFVLAGEEKRIVFNWLVSWAEAQYHEAWAEFAGEMIKAGRKTKLEELEKRWAHLPERQPKSGVESVERP